MLSNVDYLRGGEDVPSHGNERKGRMIALRSKGLA
jgi:hypothetical protein